MLCAKLLPLVHSCIVQNFGRGTHDKVGDIVGALPGRCRDVAGTLPGHCRNIAGTLPGRCRDVAGTLPGHCRVPPKNICLKLWWTLVVSPMTKSRANVFNQKSHAHEEPHEQTIEGKCSVRNFYRNRMRTKNRTNKPLKESARCETFAEIAFA